MQLRTFWSIRFCLKVTYFKTEDWILFAGSKTKQAVDQSLVQKTKYPFADFEFPSFAFSAFSRLVLKLQPFPLLKKTQNTILKKTR